jgi:hypothetical protein
MFRIRIRIHRIHLFLGLPDPLVRDMIRILLSASKNSKKNLESYCFVTSLGLGILKVNAENSRIRSAHTKKSWIRNTASMKCFGSVTRTYKAYSLVFTGPGTLWILLLPGTLAGFFFYHRYFLCGLVAPRASW